MANPAHPLNARPHTPPSPYITRLAPELTIHIASYLTPRGIFALLIAIPAISSSVIYALDARYTRKQRVFEDNREDCDFRVYTPLQYFSSRGIERAVQRLLEAGADPNEMSFDETENEIPALVLAIGFRSARVVSLLLQHGAWVDDRNDPTPDTATDSRHYFYHIESALHLAVGPPDQLFPRINDEAAYHSRGDQLPLIVDLLLNTGVDVHGLNLEGRTALQAACAVRTTDPLIVTALIAAGADISRRSSLTNAFPSLFRSHAHLKEDTNVAIIHYVANAGNAAVLRVLLEAGADVDARTQHGMRPLDLAVLHMRRNIVQILVQAGADVSAAITDESGQVACLDLSQMMGKGGTWDELRAWLRARGCQTNAISLIEWSNLGDAPDSTRRTVGKREYFPEA